MLYMVVEHFRDLDAVGARFRERGRMMPDHVIYHASWMANDGKQCFQIMEAQERSLLNQWMRNWEDLVRFEITEIQVASEFWEKRAPSTRR